MGDKKFPKIGIGVMIKRENKVLMGLRRGSHGAGEWCFPGGHLDFGETMEECARREVKEETGLDVSEIKLICVADEMRYIKIEGKHYVMIGFFGEYLGGEPETMEPEKFKEWKWFDLDDLPKNLFEGTELMVKNYKANKIY